MSAEITIEPLGIDQLEEIVPVGLAFTAENANMAGNRFQSGRFLENWRATGLIGMTEVLVARSLAGTIIGTLGWGLIDHPFVDAKTASECFWYVFKEYRRGPAGLLLFDTFEDRAIRKGADELLMVHIKANGLPDLQTFYEKRGYTLIEQTFRRRINQHCICK